MDPDSDFWPDPDSTNMGPKHCMIQVPVQAWCQLKFSLKKFKILLSQLAGVPVGSVVGSLSLSGTAQ